MMSYRIAQKSCYPSNFPYIRDTRFRFHDVLTPAVVSSSQLFETRPSERVENSTYT